ncbi:MAG: DUF2490 domain-containing protein [Balneolaceae bacterium]
MDVETYNVKRISYLLRYLGIPLLFFVLAKDVNSQNTERIWGPSVTYSWDQTDLISFKLKAELFTSLNNFNNTNVLKHAESSLFFTYKLKNGVKIGGGYLYRQASLLNSTPLHENRITEQLDLSGSVFGVNSSHRIRLEQRMRTQGFANRGRYRLTMKFPHKNKSGNYFKASDEVLFSLDENDFSGDNRIFIGYGITLNNDLVLEFGGEHRTNDFLELSGPNHIFLFTTDISF